ncbi:50S ribosomal protein L10 [Candidatus Micrarchaeota archaeon]|nr:50S ribosomal protein L10 [Candidatus Micrarchaeota archaeon]
MAYKADVNRKAVKEKIEKVKEVTHELKRYKTVALISLEKLPDALFQSLRRKIREDGGKVFVLKKPVITRVLHSNAQLAARLPDCDRPVALALTNWSPYNLNKFLKDNKKRRPAKINEIAISEIIVHEGETDLPPGPALSELKAGGVNAQIKGGKIIVAKESVIAKKGEKITVAKAKALQTLGVKPFETRARLVFGFDGEYIYASDLLDIGDTLNTDLQASIRDAFNISVNAGYPTSLNAEHLLQEAFRQALNAAVNGELYTIVTMDQLLLSALRQGKALSEVQAKESAPAEQKTEEKNEG